MSAAPTPDWLAGGEGERVVWEGSPRLSTALPGIVVGLLVAVAGGGAAVVVPEVPAVLAALPVLVGALVALYAFLWVRRTRYVVTDRACYRRTGVVARRVERLSRSRVQNSSFEQGVLGSVLGYGTVSVVAAGGGSVSFSRIENPREVREIVDRSRSVPGNVEQWRAVREEARALRAAVER